MKKKSLDLLIFFIILSGICSTVSAQLQGTYNVTGYYFDTAGSHPINTKKYLLLTLGYPDYTNYQCYFGDSTKWTFQFWYTTSSNTITFWQAVGLPYPAPQSGFMSADNPGGFIYSSVDQPGYSPYLKSTYYNTYDPVSMTFYMHYGLGNGASSQNGYTTQVYEKWVKVPLPNITSFTPTTGTSGTEVTIRGTDFGTPYRLDFGDRQADIITSVTDTTIKAIVGSGSSGAITVYNNNGQGTLGGFNYVPPIPVNTLWKDAGNPDFSTENVTSVSITSGEDNIPYVVFSDSTIQHKIRVMKLDPVTNFWINVGDPVSSSKCNYPNIVFDNNNFPVVAYTDSLNFITVKKFNGSTWTTVGTEAFAHPLNLNYESRQVSLALDNTNNPYIINEKYEVIKYNGSTWISLGPTGININKYYPNPADLAIDKKTNIPYIVTCDTTHAAVVKKYESGVWVNVGPIGFTNSKLGVYFPDIALDSSGTPIVSFQDDNGREQTSVYKFDGINWQPIGYKYFSPGHTNYTSIALDGSGIPSIIFNDVSYNNQGTVMRFNPLSQLWEILDARGFVPCLNYTQNSITMINNIPYIVFSDKLNGNKVSVMYYPSSVLALEWLSVTASRVSKNDIKINWATASEINVKAFTVQRSLNGIDFSGVSTVTAANSSNGSSYEFIDRNATSKGHIVFYRILETDIDGKFTYSKIVTVTVENGEIEISLSPNPAHGTIHITGLNAGINNTLKVISIDGRLIRTVIAQTDTYDLDISNLPKGIYYLKVDDGKSKSYKFIKE